MSSGKLSFFRASFCASNFTESSGQLLRIKRELDPLNVRVLCERKAVLSETGLKLPVESAIPPWQVQNRRRAGPMSENPMFPCPVCTGPREVLLTKKDKPYLICNPCGVQVFV